MLALNLLVGNIRVHVLGCLPGVLPLVDLRGRLGGRGRVCAEALEKVREGRRGKKHAGQVRQTLVLVNQGPVLSPQVTVLGYLAGDLGFKLSDVF